NVDLVSKVDFILNGTVTFPFTSYKLIKQVQPATVYYLKMEDFKLQMKTYWTPDERIQFENIEEAARSIRHAILKYINLVTEDMNCVAQFISGGEDSRLLSALLPRELQRDAFVFLEEMNIEGKIACKAAKSYEATFNFAKRSKTYYLDVLSANADLVGSGSQYLNVHSMGFHKSCNLNEYTAVFGGLFSDALLKGTRIKKIFGQGEIGRAHV